MVTVVRHAQMYAVMTPSNPIQAVLIGVPTNGLRSSAFGRAHGMQVFLRQALRFTRRRYHHVIMRGTPIVVLDSGIQPVAEAHEIGQSPHATAIGDRVSNRVLEAREIGRRDVQRTGRRSVPRAFFGRHRTGRRDELPTETNHIKHVIGPWQHAGTGASVESGTCRWTKVGSRRVGKSAVRTRNEDVAFGAPIRQTKAVVGWIRVGHVEATGYRSDPQKALSSATPFRWLAWAVPIERNGKDSLELTRLEARDGR